MPYREYEVNEDDLRAFHGIWIPREFWFAEGLSPLEKVAWAEIHSLSTTPKAKSLGGCFASNERLSKFMGIKERTLRDILHKFRHLGLIQDVSFDGRQRVIRAVDHLPEDYIERLAEWRKFANRGGANPPGRMEDPRQRTIYRENSIDNSLDTPPTPSQNLGSNSPAKAGAAKAAEENLPPFEKSKKRSPNDFTPEIQDVTMRLIDLLVLHKPDYLVPKNLGAFMQCIDFMIRLDKRNPQRLLDVFGWALADSFWCDKMYKPNPAEYLRRQFEQLEMKMKAKPINNNQPDRRLREKDGTVADEYKDNLF